MGEGEWVFEPSEEQKAESGKFWNELNELLEHLVKAQEETSDDDS